jgi:hypothetical protein
MNEIFTGQSTCQLTEQADPPEPQETLFTTTWDKSPSFLHFLLVP